MSTSSAPEFSQIATALQPNTTALLQAEMAGDPAEMIDRAVVDVRRCMNALQTVGAALERVQAMDLPDSAAQATAFQGLLDGAARTARAVLVRLGHDPEARSARWMLNVLERALIAHVDPGAVVDGALAEAVARAVVAREETDERPEHSAYDRPEMVDVTIFKGLMRMRRAQDAYDFGRGKQTASDLVQVRDAVVESALSLMAEFTPDLTPASDRATFLCVLLDQAFAAMEGAWHANAAKAQAALAGISQVQMAAWKSANPNGFSLDPVFKQFSQTMSRLGRLTADTRKARR